MVFKEFDLYLLDAIPKEKITSTIKNEYEIIWNNLLQKVAFLNLVSPFLIFQFNQAEQLGLWPLTKSVK